ncbi:hypothetical protein TL16_g04744 [Triparma laevis f. inornata]|uniref:Prolyl 4-hydroxylase alpha subunit Fe(2+) 2OG dioxygenase domain-containing protein n=1 Tax=Triparma laevis f. inornata TaxID=1714386 RepID=A0A9W7E6C7_9STRA|nr:hypothetical protein TL16_g04744 [Triparma laevis f. inornata]
MRFAHEFTALNVERLDTALKSNTTTPFLKSELYSAEKELKFVDELRSDSLYCTHESRELFSIIENDIMATTIVTGKALHLYHNDMNEIEYKPGCYFSRHHDYLNLTSNVVTEYTLILSLNEKGTEVTGGETLIYNGDDTLTSKVTTVRGGGLLFRKDLEHEFNNLKIGTKHIVLLNLWDVDSVDPKNNTILYVTCPSPDVAPAKPARTRTEKKT